MIDRHTGTDSYTGTDTWHSKRYRNGHRHKKVRGTYTYRHEQCHGRKHRLQIRHTCVPRGLPDEQMDTGRVD